MSKSRPFYDELNALDKKFAEASPELELTVRDNQIGLEGYVVVWNSAPGKRGTLGPCGKGGTRITPTLTIDEVRMLAKIMALKNAAAGLAMGGAKSGIRADPDEPNFEKKYRRFVELIKPTLRENGGIFGGLGFDIGAKPIHARWACDQLQSYKSFTGKPIEMGGTDYDREGIAGLGVAVAARTLVQHFEGSVENVTTAVQGLGAMGAAVVRYLTEFGVAIKYIADPRIEGCYELARGASKALVESMVSHNFAITAELAKKEATKVLPVEDVLFQDVNLIVPAALQGVITENNVEKIKAKYLVEGANNPTSREAHDILLRRGVKIIPDFIANPGGIIAAYVELTSMITPEENLKTRKNVIDAKNLTIARITENVEKILNMVSDSEIDMVSASRLLALRNL